MIYDIKAPESNFVSRVYSTRNAQAQNLSLGEARKGRALLVSSEFHLNSFKYEE